MDSKPLLEFGLIFVLCIFLLSCSSSNITNNLECEQQQLGSTTGSSIPIPIEKSLLSDSIVSMEFYVYRKSATDCTSELVEQYQLDWTSVGSNVRSQLASISEEAVVYYGAVGSADEMLYKFPACPIGFESVNSFNYVVRTTTDVDTKTTIVNGDSCGMLPGFEFNDIDGQSSFEFFEQIRVELQGTEQ